MQRSILSGKVGKKVDLLRRRVAKLTPSTEPHRLTPGRKEQRVNILMLRGLLHVLLLLCFKSIKYTARVHKTSALPVCIFLVLLPRLSFVSH